MSNIQRYFYHCGDIKIKVSQNFNNPRDKGQENIN